MRVITVSEAVPAQLLECALEPGVEYLLHDVQVRDFARWRTNLDRYQRQYAAAAPAKRVELEAMEPIVRGQSAIGNLTSRSAKDVLREWRAPRNLDGKRILFIRPGGYGDLIMLAPLLRQIKQLYQKTTIGVSCLPRFATILPAIPYVDEFVPFPVRVDALISYQYHVNYENTIENNRDAETYHGAEMFARWVNLSLRPEDHAVKFDPGTHAMPDFVPAEKPAGEKWIGVYMAASAPQRRWPVDSTLHLMTALAMEGYRVFPLGTKADFGAMGWHPPKNDGEGNIFGGFLRGPERLAPSCGAFQNILQTADFMRRYLDCVVSPDTVGVHLAGVLKIPCLALYGPFAGTLRAQYYPTVEIVQGTAKCAPCFSHDSRMPCANQWCLAMDSITPEAIYRQVKTMCPRSEATSRIDTIRLLPSAIRQAVSPPAGRGPLILSR
jgi:ADP-heptose:LPS heptosyltransferase